MVVPLVVVVVVAVCVVDIMTPGWMEGRIMVGEKQREILCVCARARVCELERIGGQAKGPVGRFGCFSGFRIVTTGYGECISC